MVNNEVTNVVFFSFESELSTCSFSCHSLEPGKLPALIQLQCVCTQLLIYICTVCKLLNQFNLEVPEGFRN